MIHAPEFIAEVRARTGLVELIGKDVALRRAGHEHVGLCPFHQEKTPSFTVVEAKGFYHCHGCGAHGDAFDWMAARFGLTFGQAVEELAVRAGMAPDREGRVRPKARPIPRPTTDEADADRTENLKKAGAIWRECRPAGGTLVETYLGARGIDTARVPGWPVPTLRFHPGLPYWTRTDDDRWVNLGTFPAMVGYVQGRDRRFVGIHRTFLAPDGRGKAVVPKAKKMLGEVFGGYLRLCPAATEMGTAEGIETTLSVIVGAGLPTWAALSEGNLGAPLPPIARRVIICADNDTRDKATTERRLAQASASHAARGCTVRVARPPEGMDFNDLLNRGEAA